MMIRMKYVKLLCGLGAAAAILTGVTQGARAQAGPEIRVGEVMVYCQSGTTQAQVQALANIVSAVSIVPNKMPDVYELFLSANQQTLAATTQAIATLKGNAQLKWVGGNIIYRVHTNSITPNDPLWGQQWPMININMPQAYTLQKGAVNINIADIDSGFDLLGEDLQGRYDVADSYNWGDGNANIQAGVEDHGVVTSGVMIANTNNNKGVGSVCWQNVLVIGEKVQKETDPPGQLSSSALLSAYADIHTKFKAAHIVAVNMSYGAEGEDPTNTSDPNIVALQQLSNDGLILCASAGNSSADDHMTTPGGSNLVITVSALDKNNALAWYSSFGKVDIAAPGGGSFSLATNDPAGFLAVRLGNVYNFVNGTSLSCPMVTGVAALLMSVPGVTTAQAKKILISSANRTGLSALPDPKFGNGLLDAYNALLQVSASTSIVAPDGIDPSTGSAIDGTSNTPPPVTTQKPLMSFKAYNIPPASETFTVDPGTSNVSFTAAQLLQASTTPLANISDITVIGTTTGTTPQYTISFRYAFPVGSTGSHSVQISGINPANNAVITDTSSFTLSPHVIPVDSSGVALISIPYYSDAEDAATALQAQLPSPIPASINLYRWLNVPTVPTGNTASVVTGTYAIYGPAHSSSDPGAPTSASALTPTQFVPTIDPSSQGSLGPIGTAYFIQTPSPISYETYGIDYPATGFSIPLHEGWNMIGDPYLFSVDFNGMEIQQLSGARITVQAAADANFLLPHIYQYANGDYSFQSLPNGTLDPWMGQWLYVIPGGTSLSTGVVGYLIITPAAVAGSSRAAKALTSPVQRAMSAKPAVTGPGSWALQLQAQTGQIHDNYNFVGESTRATTGMDSTKVPKPPKAGNYVNVGITNAGLGMDGLAQDLLPIGGTRSWQVSVSTNQSKAPITVSWPNVNTVPRNYRLTLTDAVTGQVMDMRNQSSYTFSSTGSASTRSFTLTAVPGAARNRVQLSNITVNPGRAGAGGRAAGVTEIGYTVSAESNVDVSILGANGRVVSVVSPSRAVTGGMNSVTWSGQDINGHTVPGGSYILQIRAIDSNGGLTRQVVPFTVSGR